MLNFWKAVFSVCIFFALSQTASADSINVNLNTAPLVGHPAGPFSILFVFTDGNGIGDANNTVTISNINLGGGSVLGAPIVLGGASGSLGTAVTITDNSFLNLFIGQFAPGNHLSFSIGFTSNDDAGGIPDRLVFSILDNSGVPLPTLASFGDYFLGVDLHSTGPIFDVYGSDPNRPPTVGNPVSIPPPTVTSASSVPEPATVGLLASALLAMVILRHRLARSVK